MKYQVAQVQQWGEELDALPAPEPGSRMVGKREAVLLLADKLQSATRRGVSRAALLEALEAKGLKVHIDLLREALKHVGKTSGQRQARATRRPRTEAAAAVEERQEKIREMGGPGSAVGTDRGSGDDAGPVGVSASGNAGGASVQTTDLARTERRREAGEGTVVGPAAPRERFGANVGDAPAPSPDQGATVSRADAGQTRAAGLGVKPPPAPSAQSSDEVQKPGYARVAAAAAAGGATTAHPAQSGGGADEKSASGPPARGSFVPRSDSEII